MPFILSVSILALSSDICGPERKKTVSLCYRGHGKSMKSGLLEVTFGPLFIFIPKNSVASSYHQITLVTQIVTIYFWYICARNSELIVPFTNSRQAILGFKLFLQHIAKISELCERYFKP